MTATETVDEDRLVHDMPDADYRRYPAVSQSGLKTILDSPARYLWERDHPTIKDAYDFGHVVHGRILGVGEPVARLDFTDRRTKAYKDAEAAARAAGEIPMLTATYDEAVACAEAALTHPLAGPILTAPGASEVSLFWTDERTGLACKGRLDRLITPGDEHFIVDVKTTGQSAAPRAFAAATATYGYHVQNAFYSDAYEQIVGVRPTFLNVVIETKPPYLTSVVQLDDDGIDIGRARYQDALDIYQRCVETGEWPGYTDVIATTISLPRWATY